MPHSSGGSSHGGGSHSSSSSSSSASAGYITQKYTPGAKHRYCSYDSVSRTPVYYYTHEPISEIKKHKQTLPELIIAVIFLLIFLLVGMFVFSPKLFSTPKAIRSCHDEVYIEDNLNLINEQKLLPIMNDFKRKTGVTLAVVTIPDSEAAYYTSLERYAYDKYINLFASDEKHWLIVYSSRIKGNFDDWKFEGMQGNDTDPILTEQVTSYFNDILDQALLLADTKKDITDALIKSFNSCSTYALQRHIRKEEVFGFVMFVVVPLIAIIASIKQYFSRNKILEEELFEVPMVRNATEEKALEVRCEYCGGVYVMEGRERNCPYCAAPAPYTRAEYEEKQGIDRCKL